MPKKDLTAICAVIDGSSSMEVIRPGVISGFNEFLDAQKKDPGETVFSLIQFSSIGLELTYKKLHDFRNIKEIEPLTTESYAPNGATPLLDAMGKAINEFGAQLAAIPEEYRPSKVVFLVITDGEENSSKEFSRLQIKNMTLHQENKYDWKFVYLGANQDSFAESMKIGINRHSTMNYNYSSQGVARGIMTASASISNYKSGALKDVILTDDDSEDVIVKSTTK